MGKELDKYPSQIVVDLLRAIGYLISKPCWFIRYKGLENIPSASDGGFLIAANHQTYVDPVWIALPMRRKMRFMAFDKAFEWPLVGSLIKYLGAFPVSIEVGGTIKAMKSALATLRDGAVLIVFPEGAREFADGEMLPFKTGAIRIAMQADVPILPVTISGGNHIWPQKQKCPRLFRRVEITYHSLLKIDFSGSVAPREELDAWTERLREKIAGSQVGPE